MHATAAVTKFLTSAVLRSAFMRNVSLVFSPRYSISAGSGKETDSMCPFHDTSTWPTRSLSFSLSSNLRSE